jgi:4-hydroxy-3-methylbut-2-enyl diphosphate reductase
VIVEGQKYYRKGFKMRNDIQHLLDRDYRSEIVDKLRKNGNIFRADDLTLHLADEFGFCYGVDRAVDYAFQTREKFPDKRIYITGDMIHNVSMNNRLREMGIEFLSQGFDGHPDEKFDSLGPEDVVLLPAFGAPIDWVKKLRDRECIVVDTTCGSVLSVWKRVAHYAKKGFTSVIHGKYYHEETKATASQTYKDDGNGKYLILRNLKETGYVTDFILERMGAEELKQKLGHGMCPGFDPEADLHRVGVANQTTMMRGETEEVQRRIMAAVRERDGEERAKQTYRFFDTICGATQERQDALRELLNIQMDLLLVVGGYNSSNTSHLAEMGEEKLPTYFVLNASRLVSGNEIKHYNLHEKREVVSRFWLPSGPAVIGITAGASCPNNLIEETLIRLFELRGIARQQLELAA